MRPAFAYYGGKSRLAPWIASLLPPHQVYVEPFAGSAAVLFAKAPARHEVLNDVDGHVILFFRLLRERPAELERACRLSPYARAEFEAADLDEEGIDDLERARRWWVRSTQSFQQVASNSTGWSISLAQNVNRPRHLVERIGRFGPCAERLAGVFIESDDALNVIRRYDGPEAAIYVDPPYLASTRSSFNDPRGWARRPNGGELVDVVADDQHEALAKVLVGCEGAVLLSGYHSPLYDDLYAAWWRVEREVRRPASNGRSHGNHRAVEVIWSNRPIDEGRLEFAGALNGHRVLEGDVRHGH